MKVAIGVYSVLITVFLCNSALAEKIPAGQDAGSTVKEYIEEKRQKELFTRLTSPKEELPALDEEEIERLPRNAKSLLITQIVVQQDVSLDDYVKEDELDSLTESYVNKTLSLYDMKELADAITQKFADKALKAYVPKQSFADGVMYINLVSEKTQSFKR